VRWKALSTDGHVVNGVYTFGVQVPAPPVTDAVGAQGPTRVEHVVRWIYFVGIALLVGGLGFDLLVARVRWWLVTAGVVVTLEAGIAFSSSLQMSAARFKGALGEEMRLTLQEQRMGVELTESLTNLRERIDSPNLKSFVRSVVQGERLGVSIGNVMRDLSIDMRKRRRQRAEEQAQKTPVKLLLPLIFLILPTLFIVVLAPPMVGFLNGF